MKVILKTVNPKRIRNAQAGDWAFYPNGTCVATAARMGSMKSEFAVAIHEAVEALLCRHSGVSDAEVTAFDAMFEKERADGKHGEHDEAGDDPRACYREMHIAATAVEREICKQIGIPWETHEQNVNALFPNG